MSNYRSNNTKQSTFKYDELFAQALAEQYKAEEEQRKTDELLALMLMQEEQFNLNDRFLALSIHQAENNFEQKVEAIKYEANSIMFSCPHCQRRIEVLHAEFNCRIFRCGAYALPNGSMQQFPQHARQAEIEALKKSAVRYVGCGSPFQIKGDHANKSIKIEKAEWSS